jgi:Putative Zn-dependent protease, contains TPR repeats
LKDGIASTNGTAAALSESQLGSLGEALVNATYSQKQESKADAYGFDFLKKNGKNPWAMALAFEKLKKMEEDAGVQKDSKWKRMFSSHPDLDKRIKTMSKRAEKDGFARPENKMPEKIVQIEPSTQQVSNNQTTTRKSYNNKAVSGKPAGKRPTAKRPVSKRPAARKR